MIAQVPQQRVLDALRGAERGWDVLKAATNLNDDRLGLVLGEMLNQRLIWTAQREEIRVYGIERRTGVVPRYSNLQRRVAD